MILLRGPNLALNQHSEFGFVGKNLCPVNGSTFTFSPEEFHGSTFTFSPEVKERTVVRG